jgi:hypothetical protein
LIQTTPEFVCPVRFKLRILTTTPLLPRFDMYSANINQSTWMKKRRNNALTEPQEYYHPLSSRNRGF